jgi:hypothetical protein
MFEIEKYLPFFGEASDLGDDRWSKKLKNRDRLW